MKKNGRLVRQAYAQIAQCWLHLSLMFNVDDADRFSRLKKASQRGSVLISHGECPIPKHMTLITTLSDCTSEGRQFTDDVNDFSLEIPEGAIPEGERLTIDVGVALFGPFQFPEGLRPVSPVFWVCVRDNPNFKFSKQVTVTIPHFLHLENDEDIQSLGLTFLKADHKKYDELYEFKPTDGEMEFANFGILKTDHFCCLCLAVTDKVKSLKNARFCMTTAFPRHLISVGRSIDAYIFITFFNLKTCLKLVNDIIKKMDLDEYQIRKESFKFSDDSEDPALQIFLTQPKYGKIGVSGKKTVKCMV